MTKNVFRFIGGWERTPKEKMDEYITVNHYAGFNVAGETPKI